MSVIFYVYRVRGTLWIFCKYWILAHSICISIFFLCQKASMSILFWSPAFSPAQYHSPCILAITEAVTVRLQWSSACMFLLQCSIPLSVALRPSLLAVTPVWTHNVWVCKEAEGHRRRWEGLLCEASMLCYPRCSRLAACTLKPHFNSRKRPSPVEDTHCHKQSSNSRFQNGYSTAGLFSCLF